MWGYLQKNWHENCFIPKVRAFSRENRCGLNPKEAVYEDTTVGDIGFPDHLWAFSPDGVPEGRNLLYHRAMGGR